VIGPRDVRVRALFFGLSDVSSLSDRFLDFPLFCVAFFACVRCAFAIAASRLLFAVSAAFHARSACRTACFSAFSRATSSRAAWRANLRAFFFSSASRAFSSLVIAACSFLSLCDCCRWSSAYVSSALRWRTRAIFSGLKNRPRPSCSPGS
jgi:hypothetical protein